MYGNVFERRKKQAGRCLDRCIFLGKRHRSGGGAISVRAGHASESLDVTGDAEPCLRPRREDGRAEGDLGLQAIGSRAGGCFVQTNLDDGKVECPAVLEEHAREILSGRVEIDEDEWLSEIAEGGNGRVVSIQDHLVVELGFDPTTDCLKFENP